MTTDRNRSGLRCWAMMDRNDHLYLYTVAHRRADAIQKMHASWPPGSAEDIAFHYRAVRCRLVPEKSPAKKKTTRHGR